MNDYGLDKETLEFYRECAKRAGQDFDEWMKELKEGEF